MEYIYSALVLHAAGKEVNDDAIADVLKGAGVEADAARVKALTASLEGIDIEEAIANASVMTAAAPAAAGAAAPAEAAEEAKEEPEEEEEEVSEEEAAAGLSALFG